MADSEESVTQLLNRWRGGDASAADQVIALLYRELRALAGHYLRAERSGHTLQPTALVNELYMKLAQSGPLDMNNRAHFMAVAARQMRRMLIDYARQASAQKRGGIRVDLRLEDAGTIDGGYEAGDLNAALDKLETLDARAARVIELRFFAGLSEDETATALGISRSTVRRDWDFARAWLYGELSGAK
jgi:RNA polymerase sigma factor (TIGR02999 family)